MTYYLSPNRIGREIDRMFQHLVVGARGSYCCDGDFVPRVDIRETDEEISLTFELPGMELDDIKVAVADNVLTVSGERKSESNGNGDGYVRNEIHTGSFSRSFTLPEKADAEKISADYKAGILTVSMPQKEEAKPKEIKIKVE